MGVYLASPSTIPKFIDCLKEENQEKEKEKDYSKTMDEILRGG